MHMKLPMKRLTALMLAAMLTFGLLGTAGLTASAEEPEYTYTDPYVISLFPDSLEGYEEYRVPYVWVTPHEATWTTSDLATGEQSSTTDWPGMIHVINLNKVQAGPGAGEEGTPYASIATYCTDANVYTQDNYLYRRINLEDCTYYDDVTAGKIRAVYLNSFPYIQDMTQVESAVNAWLGQSGSEYTPVSGLTGAEALLATQLAIWSLANEGTFWVDSYYAGTYDTSAVEEKIRNGTLYCDTGANVFETGRETTENNITQLAMYLCSLSPAAPREVTISDGSIDIQETSVEKQQDGTYTVTVSFAIQADVAWDDALTASVCVGGQRKSFALTPENAGNIHTVTLTGITDAGNATVEINGYQTAADVFLFDSTGEREASQSLVGYDDSTLPVHGEVTVGLLDRILNIHKYTPNKPSGLPGDGTQVELPDSYTPLANVEFEIYFVATMDDLLSGAVKLGQSPTGEELAKYQTSPIATIKTDANGFASYNFTDNGRPDGVYLVVEKDNASVTYKVAPFYVSIPTTDPTGTGWLYTVNVYPKNDLAGGPEVDKDVTEVGNDTGTFDVGDEITYIIRGGVPGDLYAVATDGTAVYAKQYTLSDILDTRLDYLGSVEVKLWTAAGEEVPLTLDTHYLLTENAAQEGQGASLSVSLTSAGMKYVAETVGSGQEVPELRVYFRAAINATAASGEEIPNNAVIEYTNATGYVYDPAEVPEEDRPEVHMGGLNILKYDIADDTQHLSGAVFKLVRLATEEELADETIEKVDITLGEETKQGVYVDFFVGDGEEKTIEAVTDDNGEAVIWGLAYGEYYLIETKAPEGYHLLTAPVAVVINETSHMAESVVKVANSARFNLPDAGGMGTTVFTVLGILLLCSAGGMLLLMKKKHV